EAGKQTGDVGEARPVQRDAERGWIMAQRQCNQFTGATVRAKDHQESIRRFGTSKQSELCTPSAIVQAMIGCQGRLWSSYGPSTEKANHLQGHWTLGTARWLPLPDSQAGATLAAALRKVGATMKGN